MGKKNSEKKRINRLNHVRKLIDAKYYKRAIYEITNYIADYPEDTTGHYLYGKLLLRSNKLQPARREFQYVIEHQDENEIKALMLLASVARLEGDPDEAIGYYKKVIEDSNNEDIYAINVLAHLQRKEKRYEDALETLSLTDSTAYELQIERIKNLSLLGRIDEAYEMLQEITPTTIEEERQMAINKGRIAKEQKDYEQADFYYEVAKETLEKDEIYYRAVYEQIKLALEYDNYEATINYCEELKKAGMTFKGETYLFLGLAKQAIGDYEAAYKNYTYATEIAEDRDVKAQSHYQAGSLEFAKGHLYQAEVSLKRSATNARKASKDTYTKLIGVLFRQQKYEEAKKYLARVKKIDPTWVEPDTPLSYIGLLIDKRTGVKLPHRDEVHYAESQIIKYKESDAIEHIKSHHQYNSKGKTRGKFSPNVDIDTLYYEMREELTDDNMVNEDAMDIFEIDYQDAGYDLENNLVHRVRVVVFPHTRHILTMYPGCRATVPRKGDFKKQHQYQKKYPKRVTVKAKSQE